MRSGSSWSQQQKINAATPVAGQQFGRSTDISLNNAVIGTMGPSSANGNVYLFTRAGTTWSQDSLLTASDGAADDYLGVSVTVDLDGTILAGASGDNISSNTDQGSAYFFTDGGGWSQGGGGGGGEGVPEFSTYVYLLTLFGAFALIKKQSVHV